MVGHWSVHYTFLFYNTFTCNIFLLLCVTQFAMITSIRNTELQYQLNNVTHSITSINYYYYLFSLVAENCRGPLSTQKVLGSDPDGSNKLLK